MIRVNVNSSAARVPGQVISTHQSTSGVIKIKLYGRLYASIVDKKWTFIDLTIGVSSSVGDGSLYGKLSPRSVSRALRLLSSLPLKEY